MSRRHLREQILSPSVGLMATIALAALCTGLVYPLKRITPVSSLGTVYLSGVVVVSAFWGVRLGVLMALLSALAFNFFHLPPQGRLTIADSRNWFALGTFVVAAIGSSWVSEVARNRAKEAERRRLEADLAAEMAQVLLAQVGLEEALRTIARRLSQAFELPWASIVLEDVRAGERGEAIALQGADRRLGTLLVPRGLPAAVIVRLRERVVPALSALLAVALERQRLVAEAVQTEGLRRSDAVKTAVLRAISHDLRSPVTAMIAAGAAVRGSDLSLDERQELGALVVNEGSRLSRLIDDLLDLSKLEAQAVQPHLAECSVEEVIDSALAAQPAEAEFEVRLEPDLPPVRADFRQIERALANLLENGARYGNGRAVVVRARRAGERVLISVVDHGPGIAAADRERIFEPFYRAPDAHREASGGSGLGLAIARGFVEAGGGRIRVESAPGQGSSFVLELPALTNAGAGG